METKEIILRLREKAGLSQEGLAEKLFVTRQAVSRWENGETTPDTESLKGLSRLFDVSINTLLGSPRQLVCQCCGMPLDDGSISRETDGSLNEDYCKWCYTGGKFVYANMDELLDFLVEHMSNENFPPEQARAHFAGQLPLLAHWAQPTAE
ncbi:zinc ribbon domain-containing protein [Acutalibacter caecimuris]|uniref:zinc ribbon domain-containing protein n=1 Tax=Acutalibacter caecimuris TaxID=3093657 RepID=UPI002AC9DBAF|nr:zinc ribbon domain-containing protein [Acutalibacter sp. M00118]